MSILKFPCGCTVKKNDNIKGEIEYTNPSQLVGLDIDIYNINMECPATWDTICSGLTKGMFQIESQLGRDWSKKIKPGILKELAAVISLIRPGTLQAYSGNPPKSMTAHYSDRKNRIEDVTYLHSSLEPILKNNYGVLIYQEDSMFIARDLAGFSRKMTNTLRKGLGKKKAEIISELEKEFIDGCKSIGKVNEEQAREIFGWIREGQRYLFCSAHAHSYAKNSYWTAWCKTHFPLQFYCSWIRQAVNEQNPSAEIYELVNDAKVHDIIINIPDFRDLRQETYISGDQIYFGLSNIKGLGEKTITRLINKIHDTEKTIQKSTDMWSWKDYLITFSDTVSITVNQALILCGALDYLKLQRTHMLYEINIWKELTEIEKGFIKKGNYNNLLNGLIGAIQPKEKTGFVGCSNVKRKGILEGFISLLKNPPYKLEDSPEYIAWNEGKYLGAPITCHKVDGKFGDFSMNTTCRELVHGKSGDVKMLVEIDKVKPTTTKKGKNPGQKMAMIAISDSTGAFDNAVIFPEAFTKFADIIQESNIIMIKGNRKGSLVINEIVKI